MYLQAVALWVQHFLYGRLYLLLLNTSIDSGVEDLHQDSWLGDQLVWVVAIVTCHKFTESIHFSGIDYHFKVS